MLDVQGRQQASSRRRMRWRLLGAAVGGGVGLGVASLIYLLVVPILENSRGWVRELQGLAWNLVPLITLGGLALGWWAVSHRQR